MARLLCIAAHGADALAQNWRGLEASQVTENKEVRRIIFEFSQGAKLTPTAASASSAPLAMQAPPELPVPSSEGFSEPLFLPGRISRQAVPAARAPDVTTEAAAAPMAAITPEDATSGPAAPQSSEEVDSISARTATLAVASVIDALVASAEAQDATSPQ